MQEGFLDGGTPPGSVASDEAAALALQKQNAIKKACGSCAAAHASCSGTRPCSRCEQLGLQDSCVDLVSKKRGRRPKAANASDGNPSYDGSSPQPQAGSFIGGPSSMFPSFSSSSSSAAAAAGSSLPSSAVSAKKRVKRTPKPTIGSLISNASSSVGVGASSNNSGVKKKPKRSSSSSKTTRKASSSSAPSAPRRSSSSSKSSSKSNPNKNLYPPYSSSGQFNPAFYANLPYPPFDNGNPYHVMYGHHAASFPMPAGSSSSSPFYARPPLPGLPPHVSNSMVDGAAAYDQYDDIGDDASDFNRRNHSGSEYSESGDSFEDDEGEEELVDENGNVIKRKKSKSARRRRRKTSNEEGAGESGDEDGSEENSEDYSDDDDEYTDSVDEEIDRNFEALDDDEKRRLILELVPDAESLDLATSLLDVQRLPRLYRVASREAMKRSASRDSLPLKKSASRDSLSLKKSASRDSLLHQTAAVTAANTAANGAVLSSTGALIRSASRDSLNLAKSSSRDSLKKSASRDSLKRSGSSSSLSRSHSSSSLTQTNILQLQQHQQQLLQQQHHDVQHSMHMSPHSHVISQSQQHPHQQHQPSLLIPGTQIPPSSMPGSQSSPIGISMEMPRHVQQSHQMVAAALNSRANLSAKALSHRFITPASLPISYGDIIMHGSHLNGGSRSSSSSGISSPIQHHPAAASLLRESSLRFNLSSSASSSSSSSSHNGSSSLPPSSLTRISDPISSQIPPPFSASNDFMQNIKLLDDDSGAVGRSSMSAEGGILDTLSDTGSMYSNGSIISDYLTGAHRRHRRGKSNMMDMNGLNGLSSSNSLLSSSSHQHQSLLTAGSAAAAMAAVSGVEAASSMLSNPYASSRHWASDSDSESQSHSMHPMNLSHTIDGISSDRTVLVAPMTPSDNPHFIHPADSIMQRHLMESPTAAAAAVVTAAAAASASSVLRGITSGAFSSSGGNGPEDAAMAAAAAFASQQHMTGLTEVASIVEAKETIHRLLRQLSATRRELNAAQLLANTVDLNTLPDSACAYRQAFEQAPFAVLFLSLEGLILHWNKAAQSLWLYEEDDLGSRVLSWKDLVHSAEWNDMSNAFQLALQMPPGERGFLQEHRCVDSSRQIFKARLHVGVVCDAEGKPLYITNHVIGHEKPVRQ